jgi:hypothetical protein
MTYPNLIATVGKTPRRTRTSCEESPPVAHSGRQQSWTEFVGGNGDLLELERECIEEILPRRNNFLGVREKHISVSG